MLIHIKRNAEVFGPYSIEEAREYLSRARLLLSDFAQLPGTTEWIPLASVPGVRSAPPPPPATTLPPPTIAQPAGPQQQAAPLPTVTQPVVPREQAQHSELRLRAVLNDAAGILFLSLLLGAIVWIFAEPGRRMSAIEVTEALVIAVCLTISACSATGNRWRHVACVALFGWAWSIINV